MPEKFIIQGGKPLKGVIEVRGAKNAVFPIIAAALLTKDECIISNIPLIEDVFRMIEILESTGAEVSWIDKRTVKIRARNISSSKIREDLVVKLRGSILFFGPLLARLGEIKFPQPGGCLIGARPIDTHLDAFSQLGVGIEKNGQSFLLKTKSIPKNRTVVLNEFSVTATENILLFSSLIPGKTVIKIADADYQIQELAKFLKKMGVKIKGAGTHTIAVYGAKKLKGVKHKLIYDPIEAGTFMIMAAATRGNVTIKNAEISFLELPLKKLKDFGVPYEILDKSTVKILPWKFLKIDKIQALPYP